MPDYKNPWQTVSIERIYDNPWIAVSHRDVINPSGNKGIYGVVHFKNLAIGIVPLDEEGNTWLVGQYRYTIDQYSWEIPEGGCPLGTDPLASAQRELLEETGITAGKWEKILDFHTSNSVTDEAGMVFLARELSFGPSQPEETEKLEVRKLPFSEAVKMVESGEITDSLSIMALLRVRLML
ncbi:MAG: NUDIX hydrolase [Lewinellaceae bacterium]|nr:NUDIX hydrolase [Lewinellaceae bacterium]